MIRGKRVSLVCGGQPRDRVENNYEVIVRVNDHRAEDETRTDVLYTSCVSKAQEILEREHPRFVWFDGNSPNARFWDACCKTYGVERALFWREAPRSAENFRNFRYSWGPEWDSSFQFTYQICPLTGLLAAWHLALLKPAELFITGMYFYADENNVVSGDRHVFDLLRQLEVFYDAVMENTFVKCDARLREITKKNIPSVFLDTKDREGGLCK